MADATKYAVRTKGEPIRVKRFHLTEDCPRIRDNPMGEVLTVEDRDIDLLGLKLCSTCEDRHTGGPAIDALAEIMESGFVVPEQTPEESAWTILDGLRERGFYISQRRKKDEPQETTG